MNIIHNQNVGFRCPNILREKLQTYADENHLRVSAVIRTACVSFLRKEQLTSCSTSTPALSGDPRLKELAR